MQKEQTKGSRDRHTSTPSEYFTTPLFCRAGHNWPHMSITTMATTTVPSSLLQCFYIEIGLRDLVCSPFDAKLLCLQRLVRLFAYGSSTLILPLYLSALGNSESRIGLFITLTLVGDVVISLILAVVADGIGRRRMLAFGSLLMSCSGAIFATCTNYWVLLAASVFGVIAPRRAVPSLLIQRLILIVATVVTTLDHSKAIEESMLSQLIPLQKRSNVIAWYYLIGTLGATTGTILCGWAVQQFQKSNTGPLSSHIK